MTPETETSENKENSFIADKFIQKKKGVSPKLRHTPVEESS